MFNLAQTDLWLSVPSLSIEPRLAQRLILERSRQDSCPRASTK